MSPEAGEISVPMPASLLFSCRVLGKLPDLPEHRSQANMLLEY